MQAAVGCSSLCQLRRYQQLVPRARAPARVSLARSQATPSLVRTCAALIGHSSGSAPRSTPASLRVSSPQRSRVMQAVQGASGELAFLASPAAFGFEQLRPWAHWAASLGAFVLADQLLLSVAAANGVTFPPPLLGMFAIIAALLLYEARFGTAAVERVTSAMSPGIDWIGRWLPLFYVPSLVTLPLALQALPGALLFKVFGLLCCGWVASLLFAAFVTVRIRAVTNVELLPVPPAPKPPGFSDANRAGWALALAASSLGLLAAPPALAHAAGAAFMLSATVCGFLAGSATPAVVQKVLHPLITTGLVANGAAWLLGLCSGAGYDSVLRAYLTKGKAGAALGAGDFLMAFLHSVILSFGFRVFAQRQLMRRHFAEIMGCVLSSSFVGMALSCVLGTALALPPQLSLALAPRSVTVALALPIASMLGASSHASLTAAAVMFTGLLGANFAQPMLTAAGFRDPVVRGLATAASAHGLGTAALAAKEPEALPMAALAYATMGVTSSLLVTLPQMRALLGAMAGM